jgi:hypothetical protein
MKYILLIYASDQAWAAQTPAQLQEVMGRYRVFTESIRASGQMVGGDKLEPASTATTVRVRDGKTLTTDGPFAETKEQLGGFYLIEAKDLDEAIGIAARIPGAAYGSVEVRPVSAMPPMPPR